MDATDEKKELMERMQPPKGTRPTDVAKQKGDKWVMDPATGEQVLLRHPRFEGTCAVYLFLFRILTSCDRFL